MEHILDVLGGIDPSSLAYALIVLAETNPYDPLIGGLLLAVELIEDRRQWRADEVASMRAVNAAYKADRRRRVQAWRTPVEPVVDYPPDRGAA